MEKVVSDDISEYNTKITALKAISLERGFPGVELMIELDHYPYPLDKTDDTNNLVAICLRNQL